jgi:uncharacterized protein (DUF488 family)
MAIERQTLDPNPGPVLRVGSIGYQDRRLDEFTQDLANAGVQVLVDVRDRAWSQRPDFRKVRLAQALAARGIQYMHLKEAGNPFRPKPGEGLSIRECAERYKAQLEKHPEAIQMAIDLSRKSYCAFFCYERELVQCHRSILLTCMREVVGKLEIQPIGRQ